MKTIKLKKAIKFNNDKELYSNVSFTTYSDGKIAVIVNTDKNEGRFTPDTLVISVNIEDTNLNEFALDDNNIDFDFCYAVIDQLVDMGIIDDNEMMKMSGYHAYSVYKVSDAIIKAMEDNGER